jgi:signal transduction histidine kinase
MREARIARALREVAGALGAFVEVDELVVLIKAQLLELMNASGVALLLHDERNRQLVSHPGLGSQELVVTLDREEGLLNDVLRSGRRTKVDDLSTSEFEAEWDEALDTHSASCVVAPLKNNLGRSMGVLLVLSPERDHFIQDDVDVLSIFAKQAAMAIDNSRLLASLIRKNQQLSQAQEQLTRRVRDLELLFELERKTAQADSHEHLARAVLESLASACNADGALLVLSEEEGTEYLDYSLVRAAQVTGTLSEPPSDFLVKVSKTRHGLLESVFSSSRALQLDAASSSLEIETIGEVRSLIAEPLEGEADLVLGALALINKRGGPFTAEDVGLLRLVGANLSTAVRLFDIKQTRGREERLSSIGRLLSQVVHDLKSPLTVISGYVQLMEDSAEPERRKEYAAAILKQFRAMGAMQREVLAFARGETEIFARWVIMDRLLSDLTEQMKLELVTQKVTLQTSATPRLVAHLDSERLMRALMNLIRNAAEAMAPEGGTVSIRASAEGSTLSIRVLDTGPGVPAKIAPRLFQSFVTSGKSEGTGLGLAIVKRIVEEHGGSVRLCPVSRGACFVMRFPDAVQPEERNSEAALSLISEPNEASASKKGVAKKPSPAKTAANKVPAKATPAKKSPVKKAAIKKSPAKPAPTKRPAKKQTSKAKSASQESLNRRGSKR